MGEKGFTLVELLGVIVILSIVLLIAIPNISSILKRSKNDQYITDAKKMVSLTEYEIRKGNINKPATGQIIKVTLEYLSTGDLETDPEGDDYDLVNSYVIVVRKDGYLKYYVNLLSVNRNGISLVDSENLTGDDRYSYISKGISLLDDNAIKTRVGVNGTIDVYQN